MTNTITPARLRFAVFSLASALATAPGQALAQSEAAAMTPSAEIAEPASTGSVETIIQKWPKPVVREARLLIDRYGQPASFTENELVWTDNGPWRKTVLHREGLTRSMLGKSRDHLEQVISREVPQEKVAELAKFDKRIKVNADTGELSSRSDSESMNFLALNLADDIITGQRSAADARAFALRVKTLEKAGKSSPYLDGLMFTLRPSKPAEPEPMTP